MRIVFFFGGGGGGGGGGRKIKCGTPLQIVHSLLCACSTGHEVKEYGYEVT